MWQKGAQHREQDNWPERHFKSSLTPYQRETAAFALLVGTRVGSPQFMYGDCMPKVGESGSQEVMGFHVSLVTFLLYDLEINFLSIGFPPFHAQGQHSLLQDGSEIG